MMMDSGARAAPLAAGTRGLMAQTDAHGIANLEDLSVLYVHQLTELVRYDGYGP